MMNPTRHALSFERRLAERPVSVLPPATDRPPGRVIQLEPHRRQVASTQRDASVNAAWDDLLAAVREAWTWRDPESLMAVDFWVERLRESVLEDWGYPLRNG